MTQIILNKLYTNIMKYVNFHEADIPKESRATLHDAVVEDALSFFKYHTYNHNIGDVLVHTTADALNICLHIYQKYDDNLQIVHIDGDDCVRNIHPKFHRNPVNTEENHYDAVVLDPSNTVKKLKKKPKTTILEPIIIESSPEDSQHIPESNIYTTIVITPREEPIIIPDRPEMSNVEPELKKPKIDDIKSENELDEIHNIAQFPNMDVDYFFMRAFNSYDVIKTEEFQVEQNDE